MSVVLLESFAGVTTAARLAGKWTSVDSGLRLADTEDCSGLHLNAAGTGFRPLRYDFQADEIDTFLWLSWRYQPNTLAGDAGGNTFLCAIGESNEPGDENDVYFGYHDSGQIRVWRGPPSGNIIYQSASSMITAGVPFDIGFEISKSTTTGTLRVFLSGDLLASLTGLNTWNVSQVVGDKYSRVMFSPNGDAGDNDDSWMRNVAVGNSLGTKHRSYPGVRGVVVAMPSSDGPSEEWGPGEGAGGNFTLVDEKAVTDGTDYITADGNNLEDLYFFAPTEGTGDLDAVQITARDQKSAGTAYYSLRAQLGASNIGSPEIQSETGWGNGRYVFQSGPGGTWDIGDRDATGFGVRSTNVTGGELRIEQMYIEMLVEFPEEVNCGEPGTSELISEYSDSDLVLLSDIGPPNVPEHLISDTWEVSWVEEDPGGFMEGRVSFPHPINQVSPINYYDDLYYVFEGVERYRGRVEKIDRRSDAGGMWLDCTLAGWIQNAQADRLYWGRIQDKRLDAWAGQAGVGPGGYVDQYQVSEVRSGFPDGNPSPNIQVSLPAGTNLGQPAGGVVQFDWHTDPYAPDPEIERIRLSWNVNQARPGARFQIVAYHPIGSYAPPTVIYDQPHSIGGDAVSLFRDDVSVSPPNLAVIPEGTWRLLIRPFAFTQAVSTVPEPGLIVNMWAFAIGQIPTANPIRPGAIVEEVVVSSCPALDTSEIPTSDAAVVDGLVYESPTVQTEIFEEMLRYEPAGWTYWVREKLGNDRYRFYFGPRSDTIWYEVEHVEIQGLGGEAGVVYNRATVSFEDYLGRPVTVSREQNVDILDDVSESIGQPFVRELHRSVGRLRGSTVKENVENATMIADALLAESAAPAEVGQFRVIGKQVYDLVEAEYVDFRTLIPGRLIRVKDTGTGDAAIWRIRRLEKTLGMGMECLVVVGRGTSNLDALIARLQAREA